MREVTAGDPLLTTFGRLVEVHSALGRQLGRALEQECRISHAWFEVLPRIRRAQGSQLSTGVLAQQVALTTGGITKLLDRMNADGLVKRVPCPTDGRVQFAVLTPQGEAKLEQAAKIHDANLRQASASFTTLDLATSDELLDRLRDASAARR